MAPESQHSEAGSTCSRWTPVCLGLLCLLGVATGLCVKYATQKYKLHAERDQLLTERNQLQTEQDQLRVNNSYLTAERNQLLNETDWLKTARTQLQTERDVLKTANSKLDTEKKQLQTERDQLRTANSKLDTEEKKLQTEILQLESPCESGWKYFNYRCYLYKAESKTWTESRQVCQNHGADLAVVNTKEEQSFIGSLSSVGWIGLRRQNHCWSWVDKTELCKGTGFWVPGQPNDNEENCVLFLRNANPTTTWHDYPCSTKHSFICQKHIKECILKKWN
ncbi:CD209 antigen-like protein E [Sardina pilchardus]|uniref:CD209 antigen-like protein E n=1 Tax=Sardina pilchardus TaxID=27697 RepID=UPI002E1410D2